MSSAYLSLPPHLQQRLRSELRPGETVEWVGQPDPARFMKGGIILSLFFIPWTAFSLFWIAGAAGFKIPDFSSGFDLFPLFGLPFLFIGIGGLSSPYWTRRKALHMLYAVTNQRALILEGTRSYTVRSYLPAQLTNITRKLNPDHSGDLLFEVTQYQDRDGDVRKQRIGFLAVPQVREVERVIERLVDDAGH